MSKKSYPHFRGVTRRYTKCHPNNLPGCELCSEKAIGVVEFAVNYMRGDDEHFRVCERHMDLAKTGSGIAFYEAYDAHVAGVASE